MKIFIRFIISALFCAWADSCSTIFKKCKADNDCCANYHCKDLDDKGDGHCALNTCSPLVSKKLIIQCFTPLNHTTLCDKTLHANLRAVFRCNSPIYWQIKKPEYTEIICKNGQWNRPLLDNFCEVDCGRSVSTNKQSAIAGEQKSEIGEFPWHAGIYEFDPMAREYDQICGGTLISLKVVISAAHCFAPFNKKTQKVKMIQKLWTLKVALGKYYRNINATERFAQIKDVARIEIPQEYQGKLSHFEGDIAFIFLKNEVEYSRAVLPICVDVGEEHFEENLLMQGTMGKFAGWDIQNSKMYDEKLMVTNMPFISNDRCLKTLGYEWFRYIKSQKLCAGDEKSRYNVCDGNGGSGLVFADPTTNKYYLRGVVSQGPKCLWDNGVAVFTTLSPYKKLIKKYSSDDCEPLSSKKLSIECFSSINQTVSCNKPLETNSWAKFFCKTPIYSKIKEPEYNEIHCMNGEWDRPLTDDFCEVECGKPGTNLTTHRSRRKIVEISELPWHAGIYEQQFSSNEWEQTCGGTLISSKVVVSAASCFDKKKRILDVINVDIFKVAVGKFYRKFNDREDTLAQIKDVASIQIPPDNDNNLYKGDIAFVMLKEAVEFSLGVLPICIDVGEEGCQNSQLVKGAIGKVAGWGLTKQGIPSERLMLTEMEFIPRKECTAVLSSYISQERFCTKGRKSRFNVCETYRGGGLVFSKPTEEKYYLRGILSSGPCDYTDEAVLFTALLPYKDDMEKYSEDKCEPLTSEKLEIMCFSPAKEMISCNKRMEKNSRATFHCKRPIYWETREPEYMEITCKNGQWDRPLLDNFCEPDCGRSISKMEQQTLFENKYKLANMEFPWHAWIYEYNSNIGGYEQICGGTLISQDRIISAAYCFTRLKLSPYSKEIFELKNLSSFKIAVGKYFSNINAPQDTFSQIRERDRVEIPPDYLDDKSSFVGDIAVVVLKEKVEYSWAVQPICIDIGEFNFEKDQLLPGAKGKFPGLRIYKPHISSQSLQSGKKPFIPTEECKKRISKEWLDLVEDDIFCVGDGNDRSSVCNTDIGGGLVFLEPTKKKYYLRGIASSGPLCSENNFGLFTNISSYKELIEKHIPVSGIIPDEPGNNRSTRMPTCLGANETGCLNINCCKNLNCSKGPNEIWKKGKCIEKNTPNISIKFPESHKSDDDGDGATNIEYKNYYRNYCEPVTSEKLKILCFTPSNERTSCLENLPENSSAIYHCNNPIYLEKRKPEYTEITCRNGQWNRPLKDDFCEVGCGRSISNVAKPVILNGISSEWGEFPWHAGIYELNTISQTFEQVCGGSLISPRVIISAAHCVANFDIKKRETVIKNLSNLKTAVGKYYRNFNESEDAAFAQIRDIASIEVSERYEDIYSLYDGDIAFIVLKEKVEYSRAVVPICIDVGENSFEKKQLVKGSYGLVAGWGISTPQFQVSNKLRLAQLPFVPLDECKKKIGEQWLQYLNKDKLCIGMEISDMKVCGGDSGGGLVFEDPIQLKKDIIYAELLV